MYFAGIPRLLMGIVKGDVDVGVIFLRRVFDWIFRATHDGCAGHGMCVHTMLILGRLLTAVVTWFVFVIIATIQALPA